MLIIGSGVRSSSGAYERRSEAERDHRHLVDLGHLAERRHAGGGGVGLVVGERHVHRVVRPADVEAVGVERLQAHHHGLVLGRPQRRVDPRLRQDAPPR